MSHEDPQGPLGQSSPQHPACGEQAVHGACSRWLSTASDRATTHRQARHVSKPPDVRPFLGANKTHMVPTQAGAARTPCSVAGGDGLRWQLCPPFPSSPGPQLCHASGRRPSPRLPPDTAG